MNRHRFWNHVASMMAGLSLLTGCMAEPPRPTGTQRAPNISYRLESGATVIAPSQPGEVMADNVLPGQRAVRVGLLLPLTGKNAELGRALQDAATLSLFDKYARLPLGQQAVRVELLPKDTGDTPEQARRAMDEALADGAQFVIGPLFADATAASASQAKAHNIAILSLSNDRAQANAGTYMFGFSPAEQTQRVVNYALQNGRQRVAALVPSSALGEVVLASTRETLEKQGLKLVAQAKYLPQGSGMDATLNSLVPPGQAPRFDTIIIPEGGPALDTILRGLSARGVNPQNVKFLGTGLWDDADLLRRVNLDTAWFASSPPQLTAKFQSRFMTTYNYDPPRIASLSYDAVALAVTVATSGRAFDVPTLANPVGFAGPANGIFRLRANGVTQRGLAVMEVQGSNLKVIASAPESF